MGEDEDILYKAAYNYYKLKDVQYKVILGAPKKVRYTVYITFHEETFCHLVGFGHLTDINISKNYDKDDLAGRILNFSYLEEMLDSI